MMFLNRICSICLFIFLTCNADSKHRYKWESKELGNYTYFPLNYSSHKRLLEPLSYEIYLNITFEKDNVPFKGDTVTWLIIEYPTIQINLNAYELTIRKEDISLNRFPYVNRYNLSNVSYLKETETLIFDFETEIPSGIYKIYIKEFTGNLFKNETVFYETTCKNCIRSPRWIFATRLKPTAARRVFPCWDDPALRTSFAIDIEYQDRESLSNLPSRWQRNINNAKRTGFYSTSPIPTYLVAFSLTDFDCPTKEENELTTRVCSTLLDNNQIIFAMKTSAEVTAYLQRYMKISPQLSKITHIGLPDFSYEAEGNWGLNVYKENHLIYNEALHAIDRKVNVSMYVSSLVALQWLGNLVSPTSWTHMWFCQTLALFYGVKAFTKTHNNEDVTSLLTYRLQSLARENHVISQVKPVMNPADNRDDVDRLIKISHFSNCPKEYAIIAMLEHAITESIFQRAILTYLEKHQFNTATPNDFWDILQYTIKERKILRIHPPIARHITIYKIVQSWLKLRSLPVITVTRNHINGQIKIVISPSYRITEKEDVNTDNLLIPVNYITKSSPEDIPNFVWLLPQTKFPIYSFPKIPDIEWIIINWQYTGYYRVKYDALSLKILARHLNSAESTKINVFNRAHIIEDAYYFWTEGELHIDVFLNLIRFISNEEKCAPWYAMQNIIKQMWPFLNMDVGTKAKSVILDVLTKLLLKVGYTEHPGDTECVKIKRLLATKWACRLFHLPCLEIAKLNLLAHPYVPEFKIMLPMWEELIYCNGLILSNNKIWFEIFDEFQTTKNKKILKHLVCFQNISVIRDYLEISMSHNSIMYDILGLNLEDFQQIYRWIVKKHIWKNEVFDYILKQIARMRNEYRIIEHLSYIIENVYSAVQIEKISLLLQKGAIPKESKNDTISKNVTISNNYTISKINTILLDVNLKLAPKINDRISHIRKLERIAN